MWAVKIINGSRQLRSARINAGQRAQIVSAFVQVEVAAPATPVELVIELGAQARMRLHSGSQFVLATHLIQHLNGVGSC